MYSKLLLNKVEHEIFFSTIDPNIVTDRLGCKFVVDGQALFIKIETTDKELVATLKKNTGDRLAIYDAETESTKFFKKFVYVNDKPTGASFKGMNEIGVLGHAILVYEEPGYNLEKLKVMEEVEIWIQPKITRLIQDIFNKSR